MNIRLLRKIQRTILKHYRQVDMDTWFEKKPRVPRCGTTACIAGWAVTFKMAASPLKAARLLEPEFADGTDCGRYFSGPSSGPSMETLGRQALGISRTQAERLFYDSFWPEELRHQLETLRPGTKVYAKVVARRIDHFIKTKGDE